MTTYTTSEISPENILLDPNNFRYQDVEGFVYCDSERFHEEAVQNQAFLRLAKEENLPLKSSILKNGYIPIERIVVQKYSFSDDEKYVVIEGNRRLACIKWIIRDHNAGSTVPTKILDTINNLPVVIVGDMENEAFKASLMGIRHVSGIKEWGPYQRSKLVVSMRDDLNLDASEVADRLAMRTQEVNRRYRAFKAYKQMEEDEEFGEYVNSSMYQIFHQIVALPNAREWLGWNDQENIFKNYETLHQFYGLISPSNDENDNARPPKLPTFVEIRDFGEILKKPEAMQILLNPNKTLNDALAVAKLEEFSGAWVTNLAITQRSLENMGIQQVKNLSADDVNLLTKVSTLINERLNDHRSLSNK
jgi:hypothetical protein